VSVWVKLVGASNTLNAVSTTSNGALALATFESVPADSYTIELSADNTTFVGAGGKVTLGGVPYVVPDLQPVVVGVNGFDIDAGVVRLERVMVDVTISVEDRNNTAVNGAQISISGDTLLSQRIAFTTTSGEAIVRLPAAASFVVEATLAGYQATTGALTVGSTASTYSISLLPQDASLTVVAVDAASPSTTIPSPVVWVEDLSTGSQLGGHSQVLYAGSYRVTVSAAGYVDYVTTLTLAPGENRTLTAAMTQVGATTASVTISAINAASPGTSVTPDAVVLTRLSDGQQLTPDAGSSFYDLAAGTYRVSVSASGFVDYVSTFGLSAGQQLTVTARMSSNAVGGVLVSLRSPSGATVAASAGDIALVNSSGDAMPGCDVDADDNSMCVFTGVPAGPYVVNVSGTGFTGSESISVVSGTTTSATVTVAFTATMTISVVTDSAVAVAGITVSVDGTGKACVTAANGQCSITGLDPASTPTITVSDGTRTKSNLGGSTLADGTWKNGATVVVDWSQP
jgi:hypothetical protein